MRYGVCVVLGGGGVFCGLVGWASRGLVSGRGRKEAAAGFAFQFSADIGAGVWCGVTKVRDTVGVWGGFLRVGVCCLCECLFVVRWLHCGGCRVGVYCSSLWCCVEFG